MTSFSETSKNCQQDDITGTEFLSAVVNIPSHYHYHHFSGLSMTFAVFHDFPGLENGPPKLVSWSLTSLFSTNMAISETKGQGWKVIRTQ